MQDSWRKQSETTAVGHCRAGEVREGGEGERGGRGRGREGGRERGGGRGRGREGGRDGGREGEREICNVD